MAERDRRARGRAGAAAARSPRRSSRSSSSACGRSRARRAGRCRFCSSKTCVTSPRSRSTVSRPWSETAIPADSWPRCWSACRPKWATRADVAAGRADAEDAAHLLAHDADPGQATRAEPLDVLGRAGEDRRAAARLRRQLDVRLAPAPGRGLVDRGRKPGRADVVRERQQRRGLPEEADERRLGGDVEPASGTVASSTASPALPAAGDRAARRARGRRSRRPASAGSRARRSRCRARRSRRRPGSPSASAACAIPSIACASSHAISGFSGLPKLRQSVRPIGSPPAQATLRAAPKTASAPARNGSRSPGGGPWSETARPRVEGRSRSTAASSPGRRTVREPTSWSYCS